MAKRDFDRRVPPSAEVRAALTAATSHAEASLRGIAPTQPADRFAVGLLCGAEFISHQLMTQLEDMTVAHAQVRQNVDALGHLLRHACSIPSVAETLPEELLSSLDEETDIDVARALEEGAAYGYWRDASLSASRGGYAVEVKSPTDFVFSDPPTWPGTRDHANSLLSAWLEEAMVVDAEGVAPVHTDESHFPTELKGNELSADVFRLLWRALVSEVQRWTTMYMNQGVMPPPVLLSPKKLQDLLERHATRREAETFLSWVTFSSMTDFRFSLFAKPVLPLNRRTIVLARDPLIFARESTVVRRLFAYHDRAAFDAWSNSSELRLIASIISNVAAREVAIVTNRQIPGAPGKGEIDIAWLDRSTHTLVIAEVKNIIAPDSVMEVESANEAIVKGVSQLSVIQGAFRANPTLFVRALFGEGWTCSNLELLLIPTSFLGSDFLEIPVAITTIPAEYLLLKRNKGKNILHIQREFKSLWSGLGDRAKADSATTSMTCGPVRFSVPGMTVETKIQ